MRARGLSLPTGIASSSPTGVPMDSYGQRTYDVDGRADRSV